MEVRVTVRDRWEARLAWQCGVRQIDVRTVDRRRSGTPELAAIRAVARSVPDLPICVTLMEDAASPAAVGLAVAGAVAGGATTVVVDVSGMASPADAVRRLRAAAQVAGDSGVVTAAWFGADDARGARGRQTLFEAADVAAAAGCAGIVVETAIKGGRSVSGVCGLAFMADLAGRCHERDLTCVVGGGLRFDEFPALRGTGVDAAAVRTVVTTAGQRISRLDPGMLCLAVAHAAGAPLFLR